VLPLSTLALLAEAGFAETDEAELLCLLGARPGKYYRAAYCRGDQGLPCLIGREQVGTLAEAALPSAARLVTDSETNRLIGQEPQPARNSHENIVTDVNAVTLARLALREVSLNAAVLESPVDAAPVYITDGPEYRINDNRGS